MTPRVIMVTLAMLLSAGVVLIRDQRRATGDEHLQAGRRRVCATISRTASTDSLASVSPWLPCRYSWT